jgi:hypothetical protein
MTDDKTLLRKRILLEDLTAAKLKLQTLQDAARKEAQALGEVAHYLKRSQVLRDAPVFRN